MKLSKINPIDLHGTKTGLSDQLREQKSRGLLQPDEQRTVQYAIWKSPQSVE